MRHLVTALAISLAFSSAHAEVPLKAPHDALTGQISAQSLRGHLSFLSSDLLEGRGTPSRGVDLAAEYIAAQFRRAGLEAAGDDGYFQTANWQYAERRADDIALTLSADGQSLQVNGAGATANLLDPISQGATPVAFMEWQAALDDRSAANGKVLVVKAPPVRNAAGELQTKLRSKPALILMIDRERRHARSQGGWLIDPSVAVTKGLTPVLLVHDAAAASALEQQGATLAVSVKAPEVRPVKLRNVIGVLRGSDPKLATTYVMLSAHYDHLGIKDGEIYNGANDDGSGTVSVIEIAAAMAAQKERPRRSIAFVALFGEELGLLGSRYYAKNPVFPLKDTVMNLNLEQLGRTDDSEGPQIKSATMTGFDYSTVGTTLQRAAASNGIRFWKHPTNSDAYFARSDNQALADAGVPAHTLAVAFGFPDYHGKDDTWDKIDYDNMAQVNRMIALALQDIANDPQAPAWTNVPNAAKYREAARALQTAK